MRPRAGYVLAYGLGVATWALGALGAWVVLNHKPFQS